MMAPEPRRGRVLLIDDDDFYRSAFTARLKVYDVDVDEAFDFDSAITRMKRQRYDLIIADFYLPYAGRRDKNHGGHVLDWMQEHKIETPFYIVSAFVDRVKPELIEQYAKRYSGVFEKPCPAPALHDILQRHVPGVKI